ncbi:hypothetical protein ACFL4G_12750, partial [Thermodesulfobacteriota bacterium]
DLQRIQQKAFPFVVFPGIEEKERLLLNSLEVHPESEFLRCQLAGYLRNLGRHYRMQGRNDLALEYLLRRIRLDPWDLETYYDLVSVYDLQSRYDSRNIVHDFREMMADDPLLEMNPAFLNYLTKFENRLHWEEDIDRWLMRDLEAIVELSRENHAELIFQNYPTIYPMANRVIEEVAEKHSLPVVNQLKSFDGFMPREMYFLDDDHCTAEGYRVMAENVYRVLASEQILP